MTGSGDDAVGRLRWGVRRYSWMVPVAVALCLVPALLSGRSPGRYRATAVVVAQKFELRPEQFPRLGSAVFDSGAVAEKVLALEHLGISRERLIPGRISMEPVQDTVVFQVNANDASATTAARLANEAATAFVDELNKLGQGIGTFAVQDPARAPQRPIPSGQSLPLSLALSLVAGAVLGLGAIALVLAVRHPVISAAEAVEASGAPLLGHVRLPQRREGLPAVEEVAGLAASARRLFPNPGGTCALVSCPGGEVARGTMAGLLALAVARRGYVCLVASGDRRLSKVYDDLRQARTVEVAGEIPEDTGSDLMVVVDGPSLGEDLDVPDEILGAARLQLVLVVHEGASRAALKAAGDQLLPGRVDGLLFVQQGRGMGLGRRRLAPWQPAEQGRLEGPRALANPRPAGRNWA